MIFIIGITHDKYQLKKSHDTEDIRRLKEIINNTIIAHKISVIAEEISLDALNYYDIEKTISQVVAEENSLKFIFADPGFQERKILGIKSRLETAQGLGMLINDFNMGNLTKSEQDKINEAHKKNDSLREEEWLRRIQSSVDKNVIFICRYFHNSS